MRVCGGEDKVFNLHCECVGKNFQLNFTSIDSFDRDFLGGRVEFFCRVHEMQIEFSIALYVKYWSHSGDVFKHLYPPKPFNFDKMKLGTSSYANLSSSAKVAVVFALREKSKILVQTAPRPNVVWWRDKFFKFLKRRIFDFR